MGIVGDIGEKLANTALGKVMARLGLAWVSTAWWATETASRHAMLASSRSQALPPTDPDAKLLDTLIRSCSPPGTYLQDYAYFSATWLEGALKQVYAGKGNLAFIRLTRRYHGQGTAGMLRPGDFFLVYTRNIGLCGSDGFEILATVTVTGDSIPQEQYDAFLKAFVETYAPLVLEQQDRIRTMQGHPRFGQRMLE